VALTEAMSSPSVADAMARENAALAEVRTARTRDRVAQIDGAKQRIAALPIEFQRRLGLLARIDGKSAAGFKNDGLAVPGSGPGLTEAELVVCELAVDIARTCVSVEAVATLISAVKGVPAEDRNAVVSEFVGEKACAGWRLKDTNLFAKACRLASAYLTDPKSVALLNNPGRIAPAAVDRAADRAISSMGVLPAAIAEAKDDHASLRGLLPPAEKPQHLRLAGTSENPDPAKEDPSPSPSSSSPPST
jgi:hypothetical protein